MRVTWKPTERAEAEDALARARLADEAEDLAGRVCSEGPHSAWTSPTRALKVMRRSCTSRTGVAATCPLSFVHGASLDEKAQEIDVFRALSLRVKAAM